MSALPRYILSVVCGAILCSAIGLLLDGKSAVSGVMKMVLGMIMTLIILKPILQIEGIDLEAYLQSFPEDRKFAVEDGVAYAKQTRTEFIKGELESYIIEKAVSLDADVAVEVLLNDEDMPVGVKFIGNIAPYLKGQLEEYLQQNFTIQKECIIWT